MAIMARCIGPMSAFHPSGHSASAHPSWITCDVFRQAPHIRQGHVMRGEEVAMAGILGDKIGEGATADIHAWAPGQVVKLFKATIPTRLGKHEARITRAAFAGGGPAPEVYEEVNLDGRFGFVMPRFDGPTLRDLIRIRAVTPEQAGVILATLYISVHRTRPSPNIVSLRDWTEAASRQSVDVLPREIAAGVL